MSEQQRKHYVNDIKGRSGNMLFTISGDRDSTAIQPMGNRPREPAGELPVIAKNRPIVWLVQLKNPSLGKRKTFPRRFLQLQRLISFIRGS